MCLFMSQTQAEWDSVHAEDSTHAVKDIAEYFFAAEPIRSSSSTLPSPGRNAASTDNRRNKDEYNTLGENPIKKSIALG